MTVTTTVGLTLALPVVCWLATALRPVPRGHRIVVTRSGLVRRVSESGLAVRVPVLDRFVTEPAGVHEVPLMVRAETSDGVRVLVLAEAHISLLAPRPGQQYADPWPPAERTAEAAVARVVEARPAADLLRAGVVAGLPIRHAVSAAVDDHGVTLLDLDLVEVDVLIDVPVDRPAANRGRA
jgi:hypothetical protein